MILREVNGRMVKQCPQCRTEKEAADFYRAKYTKDGRAVWCKACESAKYRRRYRANPRLLCDQVANARRRRLYGITPEQFDATLAAQGGVCALCSKPPSARRKFAVDHCHTTGKVRGLLCFACNVALGKFNEDPVLMLKAVGYVMSGGPGVASH